MEIIKKDIQFESIKQDFNLIILSIRETKSKEYIKLSMDRLILARELAKVQKRVEELYEPLLLIEIECFKKIVELNELDVLSNMKKGAAKWWSSKTEEEIKNLIKKHNGMSSIKIYREECFQQNYEKGKKIGIELAQNHLEAIQNEYIDECSEAEKGDFIRAYTRDINSSIAILLDDYASNGDSFSVANIADKVLSDFFANTKIDALDEGIKEGIRELCRKHIMKGKTFYVIDKKTPKFITCLSPICDNEWIRIPFENAKLKQFLEMIQLREEQLKQDKKALDNLISIYDILCKNSSGPDDIIGNIIIEKNL